MNVMIFTGFFELMFLKVLYNKQIKYISPYFSTECKHCKDSGILCFLKTVYCVQTENILVPTSPENILVPGDVGTHESSSGSGLTVDRVGLSPC